MSKAKTNPEVPEILRSIKPGDTIYTSLCHVSRSGMQREINLLLVSDGQIVNIDWAYIQLHPGRRRGKHDGIVTVGCGMDMRYDLVHNLSRTLFPNGFGCIGESSWSTRCPSNDHSNGDRDYTPHTTHATSPSHVCAIDPDSCTGAKHWHKEGGYALKHRWI